MNSEGLTRWLIQHAARNAPPSLSERLEEEWLADLAERRGAMARLRFGVGCCWATKVIAYEYSAPKVLATSSATGNKVMTAYAQHDYSLFSLRTTAFLLIVALHAVVIYALATGLTHKLIAVIPPNLQAVWLPEAPKHKVELPPLPEPKLTSREFEIPKEKFTFDPPPVDDVTVREEMPTVEQFGSPPSTPPHLVSRVLGGPGKAFPNTDDFYPFDARRRGKKGVATVRTCVDDKGRLTAAPTLARTSGIASLDEGALKLAKAGSGHYRATTEDGHPVSSCYEFLIRFELKN
jgi:periplasmic protein TonB